MSPIVFRPLVACSSAGAMLFSALPALAQTAAPMRACYVPGSGTIYRIGAIDTPARCGPGHVGFVLGGPAELSAAATDATAARAPAAANDPYPQYVLANGVRQSNNGFAVIDDPNQVGTIPASGPGTRLMWYPQKSAFRAGHVVGAAWDDANVGPYSAALGFETEASGYYSIAMGAGATASGWFSTAAGHGTTASSTNATAFGDRTTASGHTSTAMGTFARASGNHSTALGYFTTASGAYSTAMGSHASTNSRPGAFVYGDRSTVTPIQAQIANQFVVRAQQIWLGRNNNVGVGWGGFIETSTGASLSWGGTWTNSSDAARKHHFEAVDGEEVLEKVAALPLRTWSYKDEPATARHLGPTAQDFHAVFGLGHNDKAIATVDADGVSMAAIQALEKRTAELRNETVTLRAELARVLKRVAELEAAAQRVR